MRPKTISASSLNTADGCLARYKAENIEFTPSPDLKVAANIGTSVHGALENYVRHVYMERKVEASLDLLLMYYRASYLETFDTVEHDTDEYRDGEELVKKWYDRTDLSGVEILSVEQKRRMPVPSSVGDIPLTYIWDRCDFFEEGGKRIIRIVDYKTIRANLSPDGVRELLQARIYDLAARAQFKDAEIDEFHVVFDLLRHEQVGVIFSRDEAASTWAAVKARLERILAADNDNPPETLNADCAYCVRKNNCKTLQKNMHGEGIFSIQDISEVARLRSQLDYQSKGLTKAIEELDSRLIAHARNEDVLMFNTDDGHKVSINASKRRTVDARAAAKAIGPEKMAEIGKLNLKDIDKLIESGELTDEQNTLLARSMSYTVSNESVKITPPK